MRNLAVPGERGVTSLGGQRFTRRQMMKTLWGAAGVVAGVPLLQACTTTGTTDDDDETTVAPDDDDDETAAAPDDDDDGEETELTVVVGLDPGVLDPHGTNAAVSEATIVFGQIFETLVDVEYGEDGRPEFVPMLATEWGPIDDLTYEFKLRDDVDFHNGEHLTAEAVKFSVERILDPEMSSPAVQYLPPSLDRIEVVDDYTVHVITESPYPLTLLRFSRVRIVPPEYVQEVGRDGFGQEPVGTGPFRFVEWVRDDHTTVERNDDYWGDAPLVDRITFLPRPEAGGRTAALRAGEADIITLVPIGDVSTIEGEADLDIASVPSNRAMFVQFDTIDEGPLQDPLVRRALNYAVDKDALITHILSGHGTKLDGQLPPRSFFGHNGDLDPYPYDPDRARELLAEAGYEDGFEITLRGPVGRYMQDQELTEAIGGQLEEVGLRINVEINEWSVYIGQLYERPGLSPMFFLGWGPLPDALDMFTMQECASVVRYHCNEEYDAMVDQAKQTIDEDERLALYREISAWMHENPPVLFLHQQQNLYGVNTRISGFQPSPDEFIRLKTVSKSNG